MEKVQAAIAKARAQRDEKPEHTSEHKAWGESQPLQPQTTERQQPKDGEYLAPAISPNVSESWLEIESFTPRPRQMARQRIISFEDGPASTPIDMLRTKVLRQMRANNWSRLAITSPGGSCGKSTVAVNLAFSLARQTDLRTIVCDMDLRKPSLGGILGLKKAKKDFSKVLAGDAYFRTEAFCARPNLAFGITQPGVRNSAELLQGPMVNSALSELEYHYDPDIMIFDMPAMLTSDDTTAFLNHVDCVLLVVGAGSSTLREVDLCEADLREQNNMLGVVLNKCRYLDRDNA